MVDLFHLGLLPLLRQAGPTDLDKGLTESDSYRESIARVGNPYPVDQIKMFDVLRKSLRNDKGNVGPTTPLVVAQLRQPRIAPRFCAFGLPKDDAGGLADRTIDLLDNIGTQLALANRLDQVGRKTPTQQYLELKLKHLAL